MKEVLGAPGFWGSPLSLLHDRERGPSIRVQVPAN